MSTTMQRLRLNELSREDRLSLAEELWESVVDEVGAEELTPDVQAELDRRIAAADADPQRGVSWEEVMTAARERWKQLA